jgi:hypothetical protein
LTDNLALVDLTSPAMLDAVNEYGPAFLCLTDNLALVDLTSPAMLDAVNKYGPAFLSVTSANNNVDRNVSEETWSVVGVPVST